MVRTVDSINAAVDEWRAREKAFAAVLERHGRPEPRVSEPGATTLLRTIVGQQVSVAAARSMWAKLEAAYGAPPDLEQIQRASDGDLRLAGLSRQKAGYARSLAELVLSGELDLGRLPKDDEEAIARLTRIKGIGRWSAEIYLLFAEGRTDVWPAGDWPGRRNRQASRAGRQTVGKAVARTGRGVAPAPRRRRRTCLAQLQFGRSLAHLRMPFSYRRAASFFQPRAPWSRRSGPSLASSLAVALPTRKLAPL